MLRLAGNPHIIVALTLGFVDRQPKYDSQAMRNVASYRQKADVHHVNVAKIRLRFFQRQVIIKCMK